MERRDRKDPDYYETLLERVLDEGKLPEDEEEADEAIVLLMFLQQLTGGF